MPVVGVAEVLVRPSFKDFQSELGQMVDKATPQSGPASPGGKMADRIAKGLKIAGAATIAGAGAVLGTALTKGFGRLTAIENAQAKLTGLGHDAKTVEQIMQNATGAVKGTAFGLDEAATVAASAVAAGIQPGDELEKVLTLVGDAATIAGTDMGSMGAIFNKVAASNKLQMDSINQLHDAGVPALQLVADELGVTAEEASKMASEGKIDFDTFRRAMENGMGGAAQKSGETLQGAFANSMAAIGRFGANLLTGVYPQVSTFFRGFIEWMGPVEEMGKVIGERLGAALAAFADFLLTQVIPAMQSFGQWVQQNSAWLTPLAAAIGSVVAAFAAYVAIKNTVLGITQLAVGTFKTLFGVLSANPIGLVVAALAGLVAAAVYAYQNFEWFRIIVDGAWNGIKVAAAAAWEWMQPIFAAIGAWITGTLVPAFINFWQGAVVPAWNGIVAAIAGAWNSYILPVLTALWGFMRDVLAPAMVWLWQGVFVPVWNGIVAAVQAAAGLISTIWNGIVGFVQTGFGPVLTWLRDAVFVPVWNGIVATVQTAGTVLQGIWTSLVGSLQTYLAPVFTWLRDAVFIPVWNGIVAAVQTAAAILQGIWTSLVSVVQTYLAPVFTWLWQNVFAPAWNGISGVVQFSWGVLKAIFDLLVAVVRNVLAPAFLELWQTWVVPAWNGIVAVVQTAWAAISGIFTAVVATLRQVLGPAFTWLRDSVVLPVWNAISTAISTAWSAVRAVWDSLVGFIRGALSSAFTWLRDSVVKPVWEGIRTAITTAWDGAKATLDAAVTFIRGGFANAFTWLRDSLVRPVWDGIKTAISTAWDGAKAALDAAVTFIRGGFADAFTWLRDSVVKPVWDGIKTAISTVWDSGIKPILENFQKFVRDTLPEGIRKGAEAIKKAWEKVKGFFAKPINWVIDNVWNSGIKKAFDNVATAVGSSTMLPRAPRIPGYATGGLASPGWAIVGEQGPELVNFSSPARVYTATQTRSMLSGVGDTIGGAWNGVKAGAQWTADRAKDGVNWVKGQLVKATSAILDPLVGLVRRSVAGTIGQLLADMVANIIRKIMPWTKKHDDAQAARAEALAKAEEPSALLRDSGGTLPPGLSLVMNGTGRDEMVLTAQQWKDIHLLATRNTQAPSHMTVRIGEQEFTGYVEAIGDASLARHVSGLVQPVRQYSGT